MTNPGNSRIARNSVLLSIRMVIVLGITFYTTRIILKALGVVDYGVYNVVGGFVSMFGFLSTSMANGVQRFYNFEMGRSGIKGANTVFISSLLIQLLLAVVITLLTESLGYWYIHNKMVIPEGRLYAAEWTFHLAVVSFLLVILQTPFTAAVMAHEKMDFFALMSVVDAFAKLFIAVLLSFSSSDKLITYGFLILTLNLFNLIIYILYCRHYFEEIRFQKFPKVDSLIPMLKFSSWNVLGSFSNMMRDQGINLILNFFFGPVVNAARGIAMQINAGVNGFVSNILTPVRPQVIQSYAKRDFRRSINLTYSISKFCLFLMFVICFPLSLEIDYLLQLWLGNNVPNYTNIFVIIILITSAVLMLMGALATLVHASGEMKDYQVYGSLVKFLSVPVSFLLLSLDYSPVWALVMVLVFDVLGFIVGMFIIRKIVPLFYITDYTKRVINPVIPPTCFSVLLTLPFYSHIEAGLLRLCTISFISTITAIFFFYHYGITNNEKEILIDFARKLIHR